MHQESGHKAKFLANDAVITKHNETNSSTSAPGRPLLTVDDYRKEASLRLKKLARDYYEAGSEDQLTLARNENAFQR